VWQMDPLLPAGGPVSFSAGDLHFRGVANVETINIPLAHIPAHAISGFEWCATVWMLRSLTPQERQV
jgi:hypothetical protein